MQKLGDAELKIMRVLWKNGDMSAKNIADIMEKQIGWNKNTTYTLIKRCIEKEVIYRYEPKFMCRALVSEEDVVEAETNAFVERFFEGSADKLFAALAGKISMTKEQMSKLIDIIDDKD